jgi:hypothetical protein
VSLGINHEVESTENHTDASCIVEWLECSTSDDNALPCCEGLYCWVQSPYYAQCVTADGGAPTKMPVAMPPPTHPAPTTPRVPSNPAYACGYPLLDTDYVNTEYSKWRDSYIIDTGVGLCVDQPDQGSKCVSEVHSILKKNLKKLTY